MISLLNLRKKLEDHPTNRQNKRKEESERNILGKPSKLNKLLNKLMMKLRSVKKSKTAVFRH